MPLIKLETRINAPIERVFDLARSIDLHKNSTTGTNEEAIAGRTSGLIELGETVTWRARHFGVYQKLTVSVTELDRPNMFSDIMLKGAFKSMSHVHRFVRDADGTVMRDEFSFKSPLGFLGSIVDNLVLKGYMASFLKNKNEELKKVAEGDEWKRILNQS